MILTNLRFTNFMRLHVQEVEFKPGTRVTKITGENGSGKSCFIDAIECLIAGKKYYPGEPVRDGASKTTLEGTVLAEDGDEVEWEGLLIKRTITPAGGGTLVVKGVDGEPQPSPQTILDKLFGPLSFDPLVFARDKKVRAEMLAAITGVDLGAIEKKRAAAFATRTERNRTIKSLKARLEAAETQIGEDVPEKRVSLQALTDQHAAAVAHNAEVDTEAARRDNEDRALEDARERLAKLQEEIDRLEQDITDKSAAIAAREPIPERKEVDAIMQQISTADADNQKFDRAESARADVEKIKAELITEEEEADKLTDKIKAADAEKDKAIASADLGVDGVEWVGDDVRYNGQPFAQASSAEAIRVSCAICMKQDAPLKFAIIRDGSLLDEKSERIVKEMAAEHKCHVLMEVVNRTEGATLEIVSE